MIWSSLSLPGYARFNNCQSLTSSLTLHVQDWSNRVSLGNLDGYREKFEKIQQYFSPRFAEATKVGNEMIKTIEENLRARKAEQEAKE